MGTKRLVFHRPGRSRRDVFWHQEVCWKAVQRRMKRKALKEKMKKIKEKREEKEKWPPWKAMKNHLVSVPRPPAAPCEARIVSPEALLETQRLLDLLE